MDAVFVKLGGSIITDKSKEFTLNTEALKRICKELSEARRKDIRYILGHGGGSFGHAQAKKFDTQKGLIHPQSRLGATSVHDAMVYLNREVIHACVEAGLEVYPFVPSSFMSFAPEGEEHLFTEAMELAMQKEFTPLVHGDVILDAKQGVKILSTESIFDSLITAFLKGNTVSPKKIIMISDVDGVYRSEEKKEIFKNITRENFDEVKNSIMQSGNDDVTGGMLHKIERALDFADRGIETYIVNGNKPGMLKELLSGGSYTATKISA